MKKILSILLSLLLLLSVIQPSMIIAFADDEPAGEPEIVEEIVDGDEPTDEPEIIEEIVEKEDSEGEPEEPVESEGEQIPEPNKYVVTFHFNLGGVEDLQVEVEEGSMVNAPFAPVRTGFELEGWYKDSSCEGEAFDFSSSITASIDLYAKWVEIIYSIDYLDENGSSEKATVPYSHKIDSSYSFQDPTLQSGYYVVEGNVTVENRITISGYVNLILANGCNITFENGIRLMSGNELSVYAQTDAQGARGSLAAYGHGDYDAAIGTGDGGTAGILNVVGGNITAIADQGAGVGGGRGHESSAITSFGGGNGGTVNMYGGFLTAKSGGDSAGIGGGKGGDMLIPGDHMLPGDGGSGGTLNVYGGKIYAKSEYRQAIGGGGGGWRYVDGLFTSLGQPAQVNLYGSHLNTIGKVNEDREVTIFETFTVKFHYMDEYYSDSYQEVERGNVPRKPVYAPSEGKSIYNWCYDEECQRPYNFTPISSDLDLYANWKDDVTVTFDYQDETTESKVVSISYSTKVSKPSNPSRAGYTFMGWFDGPDYTQSKTFDFGAEIKENKTVYAAWEKNPVLTIDYNYIEKESKLVQFVYNTKPSKPETPTRSGYTFMGWYDGPDYKNAKEFNFNTVYTSDVTVYAAWEKNPIITFIFGGTRDNEVLEISYGGTATLPKNIIVGDFIVSDWYEDEALTVLFDAKAKIFADKNLHAKLKESVCYLDDKGNIQIVDETYQTIDSAYKFQNNTLNSGWYLVKGVVEVGERIGINKDVKLILAENASITFSKGIRLIGDQILSIYSQTMDEKKMGKLEAFGHDCNAAIGTDGDSGAGTFNLYGGIVNAVSDNGAGIGGGKGYAGGTWANGGPAGGTVNVYNGSLTAKSKGSAAGIGGGNGGDLHDYGLPWGAGGGGIGGTFNYYGGKVYAESANWQAIGGGKGGHSIERGDAAKGSDAVVNINGTPNISGQFNSDKKVQILPSAATGTLLSSGKVIIPVAIAVVAIGAAVGVALKKKKAN